MFSKLACVSCILLLCAGPKCTLAFSRGANLLHPRARQFNTRPAKSLSMSMSLPRPRGCASIPYEKKKVAVFGAGGYLGSTIFGFLQRASSLYGSGLGGAASPRSICATAAASEAMNRVLSKTFKLAYAGENLVRLTNMQDVDAIASRLRGFDAAIIGTTYQLERRPVTGNTYERSPNDKTYEFYLDDRKAARSDVSGKDNVHVVLFRNSIKACKIAKIKHVVVFETPQTVDASPFAEALDLEGIPFTYIHSKCRLDNIKDYTFDKGLQGDLELESLTLADSYMSSNGYNAGDWFQSLSETRLAAEEGSSDCVYREDIAALVVQSLMSLDWGKSRCLKVGTLGNLHKSITSQEAADKVRFRSTQPAQSDKEWCVNSSILADKLASVV